MLKARESFFAGRRLIQAGDLIHESDPVVKGREQFFTEDEGPPVEQATAAPGERRAVKVPRKKTT